MRFIVSDSPSTGYGYILRQYDGGLLRNGLHCKIFYVPYKFEKEDHFKSYVQLLVE